MVRNAGVAEANGRYVFHDSMWSDLASDTLDCEPGIYKHASEDNGCWIGFHDCARIGQPDLNKWVLFTPMGVCYVANTGGQLGVPPRHGRWELAPWCNAHNPACDVPGTVLPPDIELLGDHNTSHGKLRIVEELVATALVDQAGWTGLSRQSVRARDSTGGGGGRTFKVALRMECETVPRVLACHCRTKLGADVDRGRFAAAATAFAGAGLAPPRLAEGQCPRMGGWFVERWTGRTVGEYDGLARCAEVNGEGELLTYSQGNSKRFYWMQASNLCGEERSVVFQVKAATDVHVKLLPAKPVSPHEPVPHYRVAIGEWGNEVSFITREVARFDEEALEAWGRPFSEVVIEEDRQATWFVHEGEKAHMPTPGLLSETEARTFWIARLPGSALAFGRGSTPGEETLLRAPAGEDHVDVCSFALATMCCDGIWKVILPDQGAITASIVPSSVAMASVEELGQLLARVHATPIEWYEPWRQGLVDRIPGLAMCPPSCFVWWYTALTERDKPMYLKEPRPEVLRVLATRTPSAACAAASRVVTCHGDFTPSNIVREAGGGLSVIDLELSFVGNVLLDFAYPFLTWLKTLESRRAFTCAYLHSCGWPATKEDVDAFILDVLAYMLTFGGLCGAIKSMMGEPAAAADVACAKFEALVRVGLEARADASLRREILEAGSIKSCRMAGDALGELGLAGGDECDSE